MLMSEVNYNRLVAPRLTRVIEIAKAVGRSIPIKQLASHGDHIPSWLEQPNTGAAPLLDQQLQLDYGDIQVEGFLYDGRDE